MVEKLKKKSLVGWTYEDWQIFHNPITGKVSIDDVYYTHKKDKDCVKVRITLQEI